MCMTTRLEVVQSHLRIHRANAGEVHALRNQISGLEAKLQELTAIILDMKGKQTVNESHRDINNLTVQEQPKRDARQAENRAKCKILSWQKQVVAEGTVISTDLDYLVHFKKLGPDGCKVWVDVTVDPEAFLWRSSFEMSTIREAVRSTVAWHKDFVAFE